MKSAFRKHRKSVPRVGGELTQINVTGAGEVDKESGYAPFLTAAQRKRMSPIPVLAVARLSHDPDQAAPPENSPLRIFVLSGQ